MRTTLLALSFALASFTAAQAQGPAASGATEVKAGAAVSVPAKPAEVKATETKPVDAKAAGGFSGNGKAEAARPAATSAAPAKAAEPAKPASPAAQAPAQPAAKGAEAKPADAKPAPDKKVQLDGKALPAVEATGGIKASTAPKAN